MKTNYFKSPVGLRTAIASKAKTSCAFILLVLFTFQMSVAQSYTTTGLSNIWQDAAAWACVERTVKVNH